MTPEAKEAARQRLLALAQDVVAELTQPDWNPDAVRQRVTDLHEVTEDEAILYTPIPCDQLPWWIWITRPDCW